MPSATISSSDAALYALLGIPITPAPPTDPAPVTEDSVLTRSAADEFNPELDADDDEIDDLPETPLEHRKKKRKHRGRSSRTRRTAEREFQRILMGDDSDEPVKETAHTRLEKLIDTTHASGEASEGASSNPYWMYGKGLDIPPYNPSSVKKEDLEMKADIEVDGNVEIKKDIENKEDMEVKEKDFADINPGIAIKKEDSVDPATAGEPDNTVTVPRKQYTASDLLAQLLESIDISHPAGQATSDLNSGNPLSNWASIDHASIRVKQEDSVPMAKVPTSTTDEGLSTADESFQTDTDTETKSRRRFHVVQHQSPIRGSTKRRTRYQIVRHIPKSTQAEEPVVEVEVKVESDPLPETPFQRDLQSTFSRNILLQINELAKNDNTSGNRLPSQLRDLFPALSDKSPAITIANHLRKQLDLPLLSTKTDSIALIRAVAQMRLGIYTELVSALILPHAPEPAPETDDEGPKEKKKKISLVPSALVHMNKALPAAFPDDKYSIKVFLGNHDPFGEMKGKVVWQDGIGTMVGGDPMGPGFRGKIANEGLVHVFVDHSNVLHGLTQKFKAVKNVALPPPHLRTLSLPILSLLLRRGRPTPHGTLHLVASSPLYQNLDPLVRLGWEVSVLKRVEIYDDEVRDSHSAKLISKSMNNLTKVNTFHEGGSRRYKEQGVDEILHLKILQALNTKSNPAPKGSTIVLATGDAKGGQFNQDGFVGAVREAKRRGWMVELWSFSDGLSRAWKDLKKKEKWGGDFTIKLLDEWSEQLVEVGDGD